MESRSQATEPCHIDHWEGGMGHKIFEFLAARVLHFPASLDECAMQYVTSPELMHRYTACIRT